jgi:peptidoglycan/LPS O-acetylase OafA/YrhL
LRFVAAFAVLVLHYRDLLGPMPPWLLHAIVGGQYGVTFFFVLSGFILTYRYHHWFDKGVSDGSFWRFQRLRLARIYPMYLVGLLLDTPWHLLERAQAGQLAAGGQTYWASWLINLVGLQAWVPEVPYAMFWNTPAWSVSAEFFFYASFPFVCSWLMRRQWRQRGLMLLFGAVVVGGVALYAAVIHFLTDVMPVGAQTQYIVLVYNPLLRFSEFAAGCVAGHYFIGSLDGRWQGPRWFHRSGPRNIAICLCLAAVALRIASPDYTGPSRAAWLLDVSVKYGIFVVPFTVLILAVASGRNWLSWILERPWLVLLGEASYSLYIIHWSITTFLRMGYLGAFGTPAVNAFFLVGTVLLSVVCYRFIELPWRRRLRGDSPGSEGGARSRPSLEMA